jgi:hypothetical protein
MKTTIKKITLATLTAPVLTVLAIGLAGTASAESPNIAPNDTVGHLQTEGHPIVINRVGAPTGRCFRIAGRQDRHEHHGGAQSDAFDTAYVDEVCTPV